MKKDASKSSLTLKNCLLVAHNVLTASEIAQEKLHCLFPWLTFMLSLLGGWYKISL